MERLLYVSTVEQIVIVTVVFSGLSILGLYTVRMMVPLEALKKNHEVAGFTFGVLGAFYGLLLAFVIVAACERFDRASANVEEEGVALASLYRLSKGYPEPAAGEPTSLAVPLPASTSVTPVGSAPVSLIFVLAGNPAVVVMVNDVVAAWPTWKVVWLGLVMAGGATIFSVNVCVDSRLNEPAVAPERTSTLNTKAPAVPVGLPLSVAVPLPLSV